MNLIFAGTPEFAERVLAALLASSHRVTLVLTQPDRPRGRGMELSASPVKRLAQASGIPVLQPPSLKGEPVREQIAAARGDAMVVAAYGLILPQAVLDIPRLGAVNVHASLLPRWRGAAPIVRALLAGDRETGITIMKMDAGLDTGPILMQQAIPIEDADDAASLHDRLAELGSRLIVAALDKLQEGDLQPMPQPAEGATYAAKVERSEARIDWGRSALEIWRQLRAFSPSPGAQSRLAGEEVKIWRARPVAVRGTPGEIVSAGLTSIVVACGEGGLELLELQRAGARRLSAGEFLRGRRLQSGERFEN